MWLGSPVFTNVAVVAQSGEGEERLRQRQRWPGMGRPSPASGASAVDVALRCYEERRRSRGVQWSQLSRLIDAANRAPAAAHTTALSDTDADADGRRYTPP